MKKILILHTGGTIGMVQAKGKVLRPLGQERELQSHFLRLVPELRKMAKIATVVIDNIDSSNVTPDHWIRWVQNFKNYYRHYDGFVMTHGTDTLAYTGGALSFALKRLGKPLVLTGSQRPLTHLRTDARDNLINAVEMALVGPNEVSLCFGNELFRANRATKLSATDYVAFASFNFPSLAKIGVKIEKRWLELPKKDRGRQGLPVWNSAFTGNVFCFKVFPGISGEILTSTIGLPTCQGIVLEAFGSGNVPFFDDSVLNMIRLGKQLGKPVVIVSQCPHGQVDLEMYEGGVKAKMAGAMSAGDMTREASVVKLMHGLGMGLSGAKLKKYFLENTCGERSTK